MGLETAISGAVGLAVVQAGGPVGVIDIGSNSIRLVIFEAARRSPIALFNEKVLCGIGRKISSTGALDQEGLVRAREALARFRLIAQSRGVAELIAVATAAVRDASNGQGFVEEASQLCGVPVRVLSGEEEAVLSAKGVISGIPDAEGLVGDLGGGSLELIEVSKGQTGRAATLPLGPLRLMDLGDEKLATIRERVDRELSGVPWLSKMAGKPLYAVGGAWRNLARIHMSQWAYPLHILQDYEISAEHAVRLAKLVAGLSRRSLQQMDGVARKRLDTLPYGALVMERLIGLAKVNRVITSAHGLREGLLYEKLSPEERKRDPLIEAARTLAESLARDPRHGEELAQWIEPLFRSETKSVKRLLKAAALLSDTQWRTHPDYRAEHAFIEIERAQFDGITHAERVFLAFCVFHRYGGAEDSQIDVSMFLQILGEDEATKAQVIGEALRLGYTLSASSLGILPRVQLARSEKKIMLTLPWDLTALAGESVRKRLEELARTLDLPSQIESAPAP
jgi:exopolyphosphatase/guanosine-5'-triphosphate,3'-diphosphate pyrophosphatase